MENGSVPQPSVDGTFTGNQLAMLMRPRNSASPFYSFADVSAVAEAGEGIPQGRRAADKYFNEPYFLHGMERHFKSGDIDENTLVIGITGHSETLAYAMAQRFRSDIFLLQPREMISNPTQVQRVQDQAQSFAKPINDLLSSGPRKGSSTFLGIDWHYDSDKALTGSQTDLLPNADQLIALGVKKIFVAQERNPNPDGAQPFGTHRWQSIGGADPYEPLYQWLKQVKSDGRIQVIEDGVDLRDGYSRTKSFIQRP